jgi:hypothetical protein
VTEASRPAYAASDAAVYLARWDVVLAENVEQALGEIVQSLGHQRYLRVGRHEFRSNQPVEESLCECPIAPSTIASAAMTQTIPCKASFGRLVGVLVNGGHPWASARSAGPVRHADQDQRSAGAHIGHRAALKDLDCR